MFELIVGFLIILAIFDLVVGVSNDAVNFMNSGIGAKAARFRTIMAVSAIGVFAGAAMSNGMMDIARHGILMPEYFTFYEVMCVFLAVMVQLPPECMLTIPSEFTLAFSGTSDDHIRTVSVISSKTG